jgi:hypothetical protein
MLRPTVSSASPSWRKAPIWGLRPDLYYCWTVAGLLMWGALSDERTGLSFRWTEHCRSSHIDPERSHREHRLHHLFYFCVTSPRTRMLQALHSNGCTRHLSWHFLYCCMRALPSNGWCLRNHLLATGLYVRIIYRGNLRVTIQATGELQYCFQFENRISSCKPEYSECKSNEF